ncbi:histidine triad nucleotide-binding protein [Clostridium tetani]|uniref:Histidine triad nucleotide-binding protein n=1 Tax=Clostridium tetani TaxID=1513 RepID=A0A4Q0VFB4_CLOTA|nr:histidine triad nucleotide-binding protein [Clostridium tetani]RXI50079.1 histidine triad nucleotide-binding protein [Clostridium tetani]RXM58464.1 histidine triad nucleotide-binding protein [Clostridium tetani]RXM75066.1 histidine triad nucleotide-binding protein [Clostridium tetani]RYU98403.1 histidine triad nucleotide-binding protein [Clostridium tetani]BDR67807.1 histidine triad nucleotide-binding protein [Clostridium tetani]
MENCIFCKIVKGDIPSEKVYEDELILAFKDISPSAPTHVLVIPKKHIKNLNELSDNDAKIISHIYIKIKELAQQLDINEKGYRVVTNCGEQGGQTVEHIHFHLLGGRNLQWPPG